MRRRPTPRRERPDLLTRPPSRNDAGARTWSAMILDPVEPLAVLADLRSRGLISAHEYERQKAKVIHPEPAADPSATAPRPCDGRPLRLRSVSPPRACGDGLQVELEGVGRDVELARDLAHGQPPGQQPQDVALPAGQRDSGVVETAGRGG
jgi:hypothetical protein